jgi:ABC-2 type transport system ATP-binding protein
MNQAIPTPALALSVDKVHKRYARLPALRNVSFAVPGGQIAGLVGMNGAGKTTLLKCILDFCAYDAGGISIMGTDSRKTQARRRVAYLPERIVPPYYLTGRDFLVHLSSLYGTPYEETVALATLNQLDLDASALDKAVRAYSKGMTQKLGLASCLMSGRELLLLDEPTSGLDPRARALLKNRLNEARTLGRTVLFTSHTLSDVEELCDYLVVLHSAAVRFTGSPVEFKSRHQTTDMETAFLACIEN